MKYAVTVIWEKPFFVISAVDLGVTQTRLHTEVIGVLIDLVDTMGGDVTDVAFDIDWTAVRNSELVCCSSMGEEITNTCPDHVDTFECPDQLVVRLADGTYALVIHDAGHSVVAIEFCPWCGRRLPRLGE